MSIKYHPDYGPSPLERERVLSYARKYGIEKAAKKFKWHRGTIYRWKRDLEEITEPKRRRTVPLT